MGDWNRWQEQVDSYKEHMGLLEKALQEKDEKIKTLEDRVRVLEHKLTRKGVLFKETNNKLLQKHIEVDTLIDRIEELEEENRNLHFHLSE